MTTPRHLAEPRFTYVVNVLELRRWALSVLGGRRSVPFPGWNDISLRLFLESERCATHLARCLDRAEGRVSVPGEVRDRIAQRSNEENGRICSAREHLATMAEIASEHGWRVVVLKGAVAATADDQAVDLVDVDLLVEPQRARRLAAELERHGYKAVGDSSPRHLAARLKDDGIPVEIHTTLSRDGTPLPPATWERMELLETLPGVYRLTWRDHLWHLLEHLVVDHPERRGLIRELMLIGQAIAECGEDDLSAVNRRIDGCSHSKALREVFEAVDHLRKRRYDNVPLESVAAAFYSAGSWAGLRAALSGTRYGLPALTARPIHRWPGWSGGHDRSPDPFVCRCASPER